MKLLFVLVGLAVLLLYLWLRWQMSTPAVPPLEIATDDPEMITARNHAKETVNQFLALYRDNPKGAVIKFPFVSSSGTVEFLFGEVEGVTDADFQVRVITAPVTHTGEFNRFWAVPQKEIVDWVITLPNGKKVGGFTMRVMFKKAQEKYGELPKKLKEEELKYTE